MPKLLIVEDNEENSDSPSRRLQRRGFEVVVAVDGKLGVAASLGEKPDLNLMDMNMPEVDGWEATKQIKAAAATAHIPIIALTAHALSGDQDRAPHRRLCRLPHQAGRVPQTPGPDLGPAPAGRDAGFGRPVTVFGPTSFPRTRR